MQARVERQKMQQQQQLAAATTAASSSGVQTSKPSLTTAHLNEMRTMLHRQVFCFVLFCKKMQDFIFMFCL
jgi:hypothetical protein